MEPNMRRDERGSAMVATLLVMAVLTGLGAIIFTVGSNNLQNSGSDRLAGRAMGASEGGVAQALSFIRNAGVASLTCKPATPSTCTNLWGQANPKIICIDTGATSPCAAGSNGREYRVWIEQIQAFDPPTFKTGTYVVHSEGTAGVGPGKRRIDTTVSVSPLRFPIGIYADEMSNAGGASVHRESVMSKGCITKRSHLTFEGTDPYYNIPAAAHSLQWITDSNTGCSENDSKNIHTPAPPGGVGSCNTTYPNDQDALGGSLAGTSCLGASGAYPQSSLFTMSDLEALGYRPSAPRGLTDAEYAALKSRAIEIGQYYTSDSFTAPDPNVYPNAVMYFKVSAATVVDIQTELNAYSRAFCGTRSLVIVVEGGSMHINSAADLTAAIFVPDGNYQGNGNSDIIGTLYAKTIDKLNGTADYYLEDCFFDNLPGGLFDVTPTKFRELDR